MDTWISSTDPDLYWTSPHKRNLIFFFYINGCKAYLSSIPYGPQLGPSWAPVGTSWANWGPYGMLLGYLTLYHLCRSLHSSCRAIIEYNPSIENFFLNHVIL